MQVTSVKHRSYTDETFITFMQFWVQNMSKEKLSGALAVPDVDNLVKTCLRLYKLKISRHVVLGELVYWKIPVFALAIAIFHMFSWVGGTSTVSNPYVIPLLDKSKRKWFFGFIEEPCASLVKQAMLQLNRLFSGLPIRTIQFFIELSWNTICRKNVPILSHYFMLLVGIATMHSHLANGHKALRRELIHLIEVCKIIIQWLDELNIGGEDWLLVIRVLDNKHEVVDKQQHDCAWVYFHFYNYII